MKRFLFWAIIGSWVALFLGASAYLIWKGINS